MPTLNYFDKDKQEWVAIPLGGGSDSVITAHDGPVPDAGADTPKGLEDAFAGLADGLHYFRDAGSLVAITRQEYQTTIAITGQLNSHVKIVKSQAGLPTPQNPSLAVMQTPEGQYLKLSSDELDKPFGNPQRVDLFALQGGEGGVVDLTNYYTKQEIDSNLTSITDQISAIGDLNLLNSQLQALATITQDVMDKVDAKADKTTVATLSTTLMNSITEVKADTYAKAETYTKVEVDDAIAGIVTGDLSQEQIDAIISQVGPVDLTEYAKKEDLSGYVEKPVVTLIQNQMQTLFDSIYTRPESDDRYAAKSDNTQNLLAKTIVAQAVGFGDSAQPPVALAYTDIGEGYGERLVLNMGLTNEYLVYKSDLDALLPCIDTSQFSTTVTVAALDARINTLESTRATTTTTAALDTRIKSLESKSAATSNINDASNAALKKSILDAVALMLAGGTKQPPADIGWTACRNFGSGDHPTAQARMIGGVIELRGTLSYPSGTTGDQSFCRLPVGFPFAEFNASVPAAAKVTSGSVAVAAYVTFSSLSANLGFDTASRANEVFLTGIKVKAAY
jgi:hypothetical protein